MKGFTISVAYNIKLGFSPQAPCSRCAAVHYHVLLEGAQNWFHGLCKLNLVTSKNSLELVLLQEAAFSASLMH